MTMPAWTRPPTLRFTRLSPFCLALCAALCLAGCESRGPLSAAVPSGPRPQKAKAPQPTASAPVTSVVGSSAPVQSGPVPVPTEARAVPTADKGIYADLDEQVRLRFPAWLASAPREVAGSGALAFVLVDGLAVGFAPPGLAPARALPPTARYDQDQDGIPDGLDILIGAKKTVLAAAPYKETYRQIPYPNGDIPRDEGVCTDVVVRALRNAGFDLQKLVHDDAQASPRSYPGIQHLDANIDHRRVRNLMVYFKRHWTALPADPHDTSTAWLPGDVVLLNTMNDAQPEHMGVVSDQPGRSGLPLIINSWTYGYSTSEMDLLTFVPVTHRFRAPPSQKPSDKRN